MHHFFEEASDHAEGTFGENPKTSQPLCPEYDVVESQNRKETSHDIIRKLGIKQARKSGVGAGERHPIDHKCGSGTGRRHSKVHIFILNGYRELKRR